MLPIQKSMVLPILLIIAGGVSNSIERFRFGFVHDPLSVGSLVFNIADIAIAVGALWAIWVYARR